MMVELPRVEVDELIDGLSDAALHRLATWGGGFHTYTEITPWVQELIDVGLVQHSGGTVINNVDGTKEYAVSITFEGQHARDRYNCGIYHKHKALYEQRAARDATQAELQATPLWGMF